MVVRSYRQALRIARSAGEDAATADYDHAVDVMHRVLGQLGYGLTTETKLAA